MKHHFKSITVFIFFFFIYGCNSNTKESKPEKIKIVIFKKVVTLISTKEGILGRPSNFVHTQSDRMYVLDYGKLKILEISADGEIVNSFGRQGKGPGELTLASNILIGNKQIFIHNTERSSLSRFSANGEYIDTKRIDVPVSLSANISIYNDWILMSGINKNEGVVTLASLNDFKKNTTSLGDTTVGNVSTSVNFDDYNSAIRNSEVPDIFKDDVLTLFDNQGNIYLVYQAQTRVQKYDISGKLIWDREIPFPEKGKIFEAFIKANTSNTFNRITPLRYFTEANYYNDSLYLLVTVNQKKGSFILSVNDKTGDVEKRIEFPNLEFSPKGFAYLPQSDAFFFINRQGPSLVKATLGN